MKEISRDATVSAFEMQSREVFERSVESLDMRVISRLNHARHVALDASRRRRPWFLRVRVWTPAAGVAAATVLGVALWLGLSTAQHAPAPTDPAPSLEDLDIVASSDESGDAMEMLQNDIDFYDFADTAANAVPVVNPGPAA
jgi:hypothetical protein